MRETEWEAAQSVWLWRDATLVDGLRGRHAACRPSAERIDLLTLALAALLLRGGERVTLLGTGVAARATAAPCSIRMAQQLLRETPNENKNGRLARHRAIPPRHGQLVLIGDSLAARGNRAGWSRLYSGDGLKGYLLQVLDPAEETLPFDGR